MTPSPSRLLPALLLLPGLLRAQSAVAPDSTQPGAPTVSAKAAAPLRVDASRLAPGSWTYRVSQARDGQAMELGTRTLQVAETTLDNRPAWLIVDRMEAGGQTVADSLWTTRDSLQPIRRSAQMGPMAFRLEFTPDSVHGSLGAQGSQLPIALARPAGLMVSSGMLESVLSLVPLAPGWSATVPQLAPSPSGAMIVPVELELAGAEDVTVPAGTFPAWRLIARAGGAEQTLWVSKEGGRLLRLTSALPQMQGLTLETVLVSGGASAPPVGADSGR